MISSFKNIQCFWYVGCLSETLKNKPLARTVAGQPIVFFRGPDDHAHALLDRCCHRGLPLSFGKVTSQGLQCGYHGWEFTPGGECTRIPGLPTDQAAKGCVSSFPLMERDGLIWVYPTPDATPTTQCLPIPFQDDAAYATLRIDFGSMEAPVENVIENFMDSLHPPFVHPGLIYSDKNRSRVEIEVRPYRHAAGHCGVEGRYLGEPSPTQGWIGKLLAEQTSDAVVHEERYIVPTLHQAEYRIGTTSYLLSSHLFTPETTTSSRMYLLLRTKSRLPRFLTKPVLRALFTRLFRQDIQVLQRQHRAQVSSGPLPKVSSQLDLLGLITMQFLHQLSEGRPQDQIEIKPQRYFVDI